MAAPQMTERNIPSPSDTISPPYRDRVAPAPSSKVMWGVIAAIVVAIAIGGYMYSNYSYAPTVATGNPPIIGMNTPAPKVPPAPAPPVKLD